MKYIKLYENYDNINDILDIISNIYKDLQFKVFKSSLNSYYITTFDRTLQLQLDIEINRDGVHAHKSIYFYNYLLYSDDTEFNIEHVTESIFKHCDDFSGTYKHILNDDVIDTIFNNHPQYVKYYVKYYNKDISDEIKAKYSYLFKNELF